MKLSQMIWSQLSPHHTLHKQKQASESIMYNPIISAFPQHHAINKQLQKHVYLPLLNTNKDKSYKQGSMESQILGRGVLKPLSP